MCVPLKEQDKKIRYLMVVANLCLAAGLLAMNFVRAGGKPYPKWPDAVCGMLIGASIGINLLCLRLRRRSRPSILNGL